MEKREFASIAEIDAALDEEFKKDPIENSADDEDEQEEDLGLEEGDDFIEDDEEDETEEVEEEEQEKKPETKKDEPQPNKLSKEEKEQHAFAKLREEKANAERLAALEREEKLAAKRAADAEREFMRKLARTSGYGDDVEAYRKDLEKRLIEEEAKQHGVTPEVYKELADAKSKLERFEREKTESERSARSKEFLATIERVLSDYDVDKQAMSKELFANLEKAGYSIDTLLSIPQPEFLIRGALYDKLSKVNSRETRIKEGVETKKLKHTPNDVKTIDELLDEEMVAYAKSRGIKYVK